MNVGWRLGPFGTFFLPLVVNDADKMTSVANLEDTRAMNIRVVDVLQSGNPSENPARTIRRAREKPRGREWASRTICLSTEMVVRVVRVFWLVPGCSASGLLDRLHPNVLVRNAPQHCGER
jgi:hypothetical protein